jgi:hypothetical protein
MFDLKRQEGQHPLLTCTPKSRIHIVNINASSNFKQIYKNFKTKMGSFVKVYCHKQPCCQKDNGES